MSLDFRRKTVHRHQQEVLRLQGEKAREAGKAADATRRANAAVESANRSKNPSSIQSYQRDAERHYKSATQHQKRLAELEHRIAREHGRLNDAQKKVTSAEAEQQRRDARDRDQAARDHSQKFQKISAQLDRHEGLHELALNTLQELNNPPVRITILFLAANPMDQQALRLDEEVRAVGEMIRMSEHRDSLVLESRWAVRPLDVLQAINECNPTIVHFSGHGSQADEILFQDEHGRTKPVTKEALTKTLTTSSARIQGVFFNTCYSRSQAEAVVAHVPFAIGMTSSIGDDAARIFAAQFYSAIGFGRSLENAFEQGRAALMLEDLRAEWTPELFVAGGLNAEEMYLVLPRSQPLTDDQ